MKVILTETRQSFAHFLTSSVLFSISPLEILTNALRLPAQCRTCAIVGGVLTVAGLIDSFIFSSRKKLTGSNTVEGFGGLQGKMVSQIRCSIRSVRTDHSMPISSFFHAFLILLIAFAVKDVNYTKVYEVVVHEYTYHGVAAGWTQEIWFTQPRHRRTPRHYRAQT